MRHRFELQYQIGQCPISDASISLKNKCAINDLIAGLKEIYYNPEYSEKIYAIIESHVQKDKKQTGRRGMDLWHIFVLAQTRLCLGIGY